MATNSFDARRTLTVGGRSLDLFALDALQSRFDVARLPFSLKILLENLLRTEGNGSVTAQDIEALASWDAKAEPSTEIAFTPARVVMQDFTGVPAVVDLAAMRDAMADLGGDPAKINPLVPAELVIDHSVQVDVFGTPQAFARNAEREYERNRERYAFLRWGQDAFDNFAVVPPETGIVHQVNLEYLARVVFVDEERGLAYPDTLVGHGLAHDDDQRPGRAGLGRGRDRGRGRDARPADVDADPASARFPPARRAARGRHRHRPRPDRHRAPARARRRRPLRRVLRPRRLGAPAGRPGDDRQHEPGVRLDLRDLPDRRRDAALPRLLRPAQGAHRPCRGLRQGAGALARRARRGADVLRHDRARPVRGRAIAGRPQAPAGPRGPGRGAGRVPRGAAGLPARRRRGPPEGGARARSRLDHVLPGLRSAERHGALQWGRRP